MVVECKLLGQSIQRNYEELQKGDQDTRIWISGCDVFESDRVAERTPELQDADTE